MKENQDWTIAFATAIIPDKTQSRDIIFWVQDKPSSTTVYADAIRAYPSDTKGIVLSK